MVTIVRGTTPSLNVDFSDNLTAQENQGAVYIGNPVYDWGDDDGSGVPFCFFNSGYGGLQGWSELSATVHTVKIERRVTT